ncbi:hypothetical protein GcM1_129009 [Golovinomyces cichoracearum]|uniref:Integrase and RNaseH domain-containing protein n=1 Tax=Golovinomyces cichoracearum TaxID=62708 RepID=A0A420JBT8_9PEZI|nr:hypothetical protein GcM1_129009 [Golovinomyces cichoracearum]
MKTYNDKLKYRGSADSSDFKLTFFYKLCNKACIKPEIFPTAFSTMLLDDALDYFYDSIKNQGLSFESMCSMFKSHFETDEHKQAMTTKRNLLSLKIITLNKNINIRINQFILDFEDGQQEVFCINNLEKNISDDLILQNDLEAINDCAEISDDELNEQISSFDKTNIFVTSYGQVNGHKVVSKLNDQSTYLLITKSDEHFSKTGPFTYKTKNRYTSDKFYGIMIDKGASSWSTAGYGQYLAYKAFNNNVKIDTSKSGAVTVQFGIRSTSSVGSVTIQSSIGTIVFHIVEADTPFLLCLKDMDR